MTIEAARDPEAAFFARHAAYKTLTDRCTTRVLMSRLSALLGAHGARGVGAVEDELRPPLRVSSRRARARRAARAEEAAHVLWPSARAGVERAGRG